ncbi:FGGY family carbohydrate kinase [Actinoplanes sp. NPDC051475]|uniref:FGGY family carbohydrate kinase n=1 Tax=Actinoplanes sp. NPDC051475 TaxID=3157225 RepID=UPI00344F82F6
MASDERVEGGDVVLAIDQGTSATKAVVVTDRGEISHRATVPIHQSYPQPGWAEQDPMEIWRSVQRSVAEVLSEAHPRRVLAVGLSTQRESTLLWDRNTGQPLGPLLGWQDTRGASLCAMLRADDHADRIRETTGLPLDAMFSASKAAALLDRHDPDRSRSSRGELCLGTIDSWLLWQLGGRHLIETGNAARTQLLDISTCRWDPWLLDVFNVPLPALPQVTSSIGPFTTCRDLHPSLQEVPVTGVLGDSHAALFAHAGWTGGRVKVTYGTGSSVMGVATTEVKQAAGVARTIAWQLGEPTYALEGNIRSSGATLVWLARLLNSTPGELAGAAASDSQGVFIVPAFTGLGAPWWDDRARGMIVGLTDSTGREQLARAALESIAFQIEDVVAAVEHAGGSVQMILADGGPSANATLMQLQADTSGRHVRTSPAAELSALGAAHVAGLGAGLWSIADLDRLSRTGAEYRPNSADPQRRQRLDGWHAAVAAARGLPLGAGGTA